MTKINIPLQRLHNQAIINSPFQTPHQLVAHLGALQAQDYAGAKWSIGLRLSDAVSATNTSHAANAIVEEALTAGTIVRTWPMRGTLHFVTAEDVRWMLTLLTPRILANSGRRHKQLELNEAVFRQAADLFTSALQGGKQLTRPEMMAVLETAGISTAGQRGYHILWWCAQNGQICPGPMQGKTQTFVLLDEWIAPTKPLTQDEALAKIAQRYFTSHGPATLQDFIWWTGLYTADARLALELAQDLLTSISYNDEVYWFNPNSPSLSAYPDTVHLLPGFDEYLLGYTNRNDVLDPQYTNAIHPGKNGIFKPTVVINGRISGIWQRKLRKKSVTINITPFAPLTPTQQEQVASAANQYRTFEEKETLTLTYTI